MLDRSKVRTFVLGGLLGVAAGILLSPRSGKELRGSIANRAGEARERGRETYFEAQERARERLAEGRASSSPWGSPSGRSRRSLRRRSPYPPRRRCGTCRVRRRRVRAGTRRSCGGGSGKPARA